MRANRPQIDRAPFIGTVQLGDWYSKQTGKYTPGIQLLTGQGVVAHLNPKQAIELATRLADAVEAFQRPKAPQEATGFDLGSSRRSTVHIPSRKSRELQDAQGDVEQPLPTTPAESE